MEKEFLEELGIEETAAAAILEQHRKAMDKQGFEHTLEIAVSRAGGKTLKAIRALLDVETLSQAEDRDKDVADAVAALKKDCGYLFEQPVPPMYAFGTGTNPGTVPQEPKSLAEALREKFKRR